MSTLYSPAVPYSQDKENKKAVRKKSISSSYFPSLFPIRLLFPMQSSSFPILRPRLFFPFRRLSGSPAVLFLTSGRNSSNCYFFTKKELTACSTCLSVATILFGINFSSLITWSRRLSNAKRSWPICIIENGTRSLTLTGSCTLRERERERKREIFIRIKQATKTDMPIKPGAYCLATYQWYSIQTKKQSKREEV